MAHEFKTLRIETTGFVTTVTLCRPTLLNRFDGEAHSELLLALAMLEGFADHRVIIFEAEGKVFSAGGDLEEVVVAPANVGVQRFDALDPHGILPAIFEVLRG